MSEDLTSELTTYVHPEPERPRHGRGRMVAGGALLAGAIVAGGFAAISFGASDGSDTPEAAVEKLFDAVENADAVGVLESLAPGERASLQPGLDDVVGELARLGVLEEGFELGPISGIEVDIEGLQLSSEALGEGVSAVSIDAGTITTQTDAASLPLGPVVQALVAGAGMPQESATEDLAGSGDDVIVAVEEDGSWHVSLWYSAAEAARRGSRRGRARLRQRRRPRRGDLTGGGGVRGARRRPPARRRRGHRPPRPRRDPGPPRLRPALPGRRGRRGGGDDGRGRVRPQGGHPRDDRREGRWHGQGHGDRLRRLRAPARAGRRLGVLRRHLLRLADGRRRQGRDVPGRAGRGGGRAPHRRSLDGRHRRGAGRAVVPEPDPHGVRRSAVDAPQGGPGRADWARAGSVSCSGSGCSGGSRDSVAPARAGPSTQARPRATPPRRAPCPPKAATARPARHPRCPSRPWSLRRPPRPPPAGATRRGCARRWRRPARRRRRGRRRRARRPGARARAGG